MTRKDDRIAALVSGLGGVEASDFYCSYFECFNRQWFFEAHEVLERLWLPQRNGPNGNFYKGLIQLAGAFVHVQKSRPGPAVALLKLARQNLVSYPLIHERLNLDQVLKIIELWLEKLTAAGNSGSGLGDFSVELRLEPI